MDTDVRHGDTVEDSNLVQTHSSNASSEAPTSRGRATQPALAIYPSTSSPKCPSAF